MDVIKLCSVSKSMSQLLEPLLRPLMKRDTIVKLVLERDRRVLQAIVQDVHNAVTQDVQVPYMSIRAFVSPYMTTHLFYHRRRCRDIQLVTFHFGTQTFQRVRGDILAWDTPTWDDTPQELKRLVSPHQPRCVEIFYNRALPRMHKETLNALTYPSFFGPVVYTHFDTPVCLKI